MIRRLTILLLIVGCGYAQTDWNVPTKWENFAGGMDFGGFIPERNGIYGTLYFYDRTKKIIPLCGFMFYQGMGDGSGKYEDYTSIYGTVNTFGDREDGLISVGNVGGFAGVGRIFIKQKEFIFHYGFASYEKSYYQALYDPLEILGNNGYYYIDSNKSNDKENGFIFGAKYNYHLPLIGMEGMFIGIGLQYNTLSDVPNTLMKMDFGFILPYP